MNQKYLVSKGIITSLCALIGDKIVGLLPIVILFTILMIIDYISGMLASKKEALENPGNNEYGWNSKKGIIGIYKKVGYMFTIMVAICADYIIYRFSNEIGIDYTQKVLFGMIVLVWLVINELLSILENVGRMGVKLPQFLVNVLTDLKNNINEKKN